MLRLGAALIVVLLFGAPILGLHSQPWAPFWFGTQTRSVPLGDMPLEALAPPIGPQPLVTDFQRYRLAVDAGFSSAEAIIATAISIAENGGGNPSALSGVNTDGSRDLGLWQINSGWWPQFGGAASLVDPVRNAIAAHAIYLRQGWCAWSTYLASCGVGHTGSYAGYLGRARLAGANP